MHRVLLLLLAVGCTTPRAETEALNAFKAIVPPATPQLAGSDLLEEFSPPADQAYLLGPGDGIYVDVWGREDLSGQHVIGPDGAITIPYTGSRRVTGLTRDEAAETIADILAPLYPDLSVTVRVDAYNSNEVTVIGSVGKPGTYVFASQPTLLRALAQAGGPSTTSNGAIPTRCSISRGRQQIVWIDLLELFRNANADLNVRLRANDIVHVHDTSDQLVYIFGEINRPGAYGLTPNMRLVDLMALAGGARLDGNDDGTRLLRPRDGALATTDFEELREGDFQLNVLLRPGDIVYVPRKGIANWSYVWRNINPFAFFVGAAN